MSKQHLKLFDFSDKSKFVFDKNGKVMGLIGGCSKEGRTQLEKYIEIYNDKNN